MCVALGRLPTQSAWPDCLGFRGGPLSADVCKDEFELVLLTAALVSCFFELKQKDEGFCTHVECLAVSNSWLLVVAPDYCPGATAEVGKSPP